MNTVNSVDASRELAASMQALHRRFESITQNLAHAETSGHKRLVSHLVRFDQALAEAQQREAGLTAGTARDFGQGALVETGDARQLALDGEGFFAVEWQGDVGYVRSLRLDRASDGSLVDQRGVPVLGAGGPIRVDADWRVLEDGTVESLGQRRGRLEVVAFDDPQRLNSAGGGVFEAPASLAPRAAGNTVVRAGFQERSNVDPLSEMVSLVTLQRQYEASQRALRQHGELGSALVRSLN